MIHFQDKLFNFYTFDQVIVRNQENSRRGPEAKKLDENGSKAQFFFSKTLCQKWCTIEMIYIL